MKQQNVGKLKFAKARYKKAWQSADFPDLLKATHYLRDVAVETGLCPECEKETFRKKFEDKEHEAEAMRSGLCYKCMPLYINGTPFPEGDAGEW